MARALFISHGGGPLPLLGEPGHRQMVDLLKRLGAELPRPKRILLVSAHWEANPVSVLAASRHPLYFDYYNFPPETYQLEYPAWGDPELAGEIQQKLIAAGINCVEEYSRGYDHGMFIPLMLMYPDADIPTIQLSLNSSMDPDLHLRMGEALTDLDSDTLIIGSGFSFHNQPAFRSRDARMNEVNQRFEHWLVDTCSNTALSEAERRERLRMWELAPGALQCHPREEHLLPLHLCYGAAAKACSDYWQIEIMGKQGSCYYWV